MHLLRKNHIMISLPSLAYNCTLLICAYASYRLVEERGRARGAGGDPGAGTSRGTQAGRRAS